MTFRLGSWERVPIRLSVKPSLRYSLLASAVALTKGSTAIESTLPVWAFARRKYAPAATATSTMATAPAARNLRILRAGATAGIDEALADAAAMAAADERPESRSRFRRARSVRKSAAL